MAITLEVGKSYETEDLERWDCIYDRGFHYAFPRYRMICIRNIDKELFAYSTNGIADTAGKDLVRLFGEPRIRLFKIEEIKSTYWFKRKDCVDFYPIQGGSPPNIAKIKVDNNWRTMQELYDLWLYSEEPFRKDVVWLECGVKL